jgi:UDP:flavonoid glycosyltransferase YjiC (YdhE family)
MASYNIILTPVGSAGDVLPFVGVGRALRDRGHDVTLITSEPFRPVAEQAGLRFSGTMTKAEFDSLTNNPDIWHPRKGMQILLRLIGEWMRAGYDLLRPLYEPGRTVLVGHALSLSTRMLEEKHGVPAVTLHLAPSAFRTLHQMPAFRAGSDLSDWPRPLKRLMWWIADRFYLDPYITPELNRWRAELGLPPVSRPLREWIHSPQRTIGLFPDWFGPPQPDWPAAVRLTGFPLFDAAQPHDVDPALEDYLNEGDPPIVFTPGTANQHARRFFAAGAEATARLGRRAIFLTGYPDHLPIPLPNHVCHETYVPFSRVLPRCAGIVHHAGIGTCAQGLAAGIPQLTMPMGFDQPDNATRLQRLGVGAWVTPTKFTPARVASALERLLKDSGVAESCVRYRERVVAEQPLERTCELIEEVAVRQGLR